MFEHFNVFAKIDDDQAVDIQIAGKEGYTKSLRIIIWQLAFGHLFDLCGSVGESWVKLPITLQMKNGKKLTGTCSCKSRTWKGDVIKRIFS